jgi:protein TonB
VAPARDEPPQTGDAAFEGQARREAVVGSSVPTVPSVVSPVQGGGGIGTGGGAAQEGLGQGRGRGLSPGVASGDTTVLPFGDGMQRPKLLSKVDPVFTKEAREARAQGLILAKCVITTAGRLRDCQVVKGVPLMNQQVLSALQKWRYEPVIYRGQPVSVRYLIPVRLELPK